MKSKYYGLGVVLGLFSSMAFSQNSTSFKSPLEATGYAIGVDMVRNFRKQDVLFDLEQVINGLRDASSGGKVKLTDTEIKRLVSELEMDVRERMIAARKKEGEVNQKKSDEFLKAHANETGVRSLASGLQYRVIKEGQGKLASENSTITANYRSMLQDGTEFDSSAGKPSTFKLKGALPGWKEAIRLMPEGSKREVTLPPKLAYGERGAGKVVGPYQALKFEIDLISVQ